MIAKYFYEKKINRLLEAYVENETNYKIQEIIGKGSYGVAYSIVHKETGTPYVLKRMNTKHRKRTEQIQKFQQEISMLKQLDLSNVPNVYFDGEIEDIPFYIMDFIDGHTFEQEIFTNGKSFSLEDSFIIVEKLLTIVIDIHRKKIVHRDLRIPNILIQDDTLYIIDFGLASYMKDPNLKVKIDNPKKLEDHRSDLYYIGHFLLYLLYSNYTPTKWIERSWQVELQLPIEVRNYIERLLLIGPAFTSAEDALQSIPSLINGAQSK